MEQEDMFFPQAIPPQLQQLLMAMNPEAYAERLWQVYKLHLQHLFCSYFFISDVRSRGFFVQCAETIFFTAYYCVRTKDMFFYYRLPAAHLVCLSMMYFIKQKFAIMMVMSLVQLLFPGYKCYIHSLYYRGCIQFAIGYLTGYKIPEYSYLFFFCLETLRRYIFLFQYKTQEDLGLIAIFASFFYSMYEDKKKLSEDELAPMVIFLVLWTLIKQRQVPFGGTLMNPVPGIFDLGNAQQQQNPENDQNPENE